MFDYACFFYLPRYSGEVLLCLIRTYSGSDQVSRLYFVTHWVRLSYANIN